MKADGIMGLAPTNQGTGTNMIYGSDSQAFSFSVGAGQAISKFTIGGYDIQKYG